MSVNSASSWQGSSESLTRTVSMGTSAKPASVPIGLRENHSSHVIIGLPPGVNIRSPAKFQLTVGYHTCRITDLMPEHDTGGLFLLLASNLPPHAPRFRRHIRVFRQTSSIHTLCLGTSGRPCIIGGPTFLLRLNIRAIEKTSFATLL